MRRSREQAWEDVGAAAAGIVVGFGLYMFVTSLGFGGGGRGGGSDSGSGRGERRGTAPSLPPLPPVRPVAPPSIPRDEVALTFVMIGPVAGDASDAMVFRLGSALHSIDEMIARIKTGGRADVVLKIRGDVRSGSVAAAMGRLSAAGIKVSEGIS